MAKVRDDKEREVTDGHDGTWVGHPGLVPVAAEVFDAHMPGPNQIHHRASEFTVSANDLLTLPTGTITAAGLKNNVAVTLWYMEAWLRGQGCVPIDHLMEDAATAEISRTQIWQWIHYAKGKLDDGRKITLQLVREVLDDELMEVRRVLGDKYNSRRFEDAARLLDRMASAETLPNFLTLEAYDFLP